MTEQLEFGLGYRPDLEDVTHLAATERKLDTRTLFEVRYDKPIDEDVRAKAHDSVVIENQGQTSSCGGHACSSGIEFDHWLIDGAWEQLSRWGAYITGQEVAGIRGDNGCTIDALAQMGQLTGVGLEKFWQFTGNYVTQPPGNDRTAYLESAKHYRIESWKRHRNYADLALWAQTGQGPSLIGIPIFQNWMYSAPKSGILPNPSGSLIGYHALPLFWPTKNMVGSRYNFEGPNSWGKQWGNQGWFELTPPIIDWLFTYPNVVILGLSGMAESQAVARPIDRIKNSYMRR